MRKILGDLFTGKDGVTHDLGRWSWAVSTAGVLGAAAWNGLHAGAIDLMQLGGAICAVVAAHGSALWAKRDTEPEQK